MAEIKKQVMEVFSQPTVTIPDMVEKQNNSKPYLNYGNDNKYPQYLWSLYLRSSLLQSITNGIVDYVMGEGIIPNEFIKTLHPYEINKDHDKLYDIIKRILVDYIIFGGFAIQVIYNKLHQISELYWLDFQNVRVDKECKRAFYTDDWVRHSNDAIEYEVFDGTQNSGSCVFYYKGHVTRGTYPIPIYSGAIPAIETSASIAKFHLNSIKNNFSGNFVINFNNGVPSNDVQDEIETKIKEKFSGEDNAGKFMVSFNDSKDNGVTVERIQDDTFDKKYDALRTSTFKEIFIAFRTQPQLFGFSLEGTAFNTQEFQESFKLFNKTTISPIQDDITRCFDRLYGLKDTIKFIPFQLQNNVEQ